VRRDAAGCACLLAGLLAFAPDPAWTREAPPTDRPPGATVGYRIEQLAETGRDLAARFTTAQLAVLEKINRADVVRLPRQEELVIPAVWHDDEVQYSPFPLYYPGAADLPKFLVVDQPAQAFAAYEAGRLVRWGPVSSGRQAHPTPDGLFHLNWRSPGRRSTVNPRWYMRWYFNFHNTRGLALHEYALPGYPASHACIRLLERDAVWIYHWGQGWTLDARETTVIEPGTPVLIVGQYGFGKPAPWRSLDHLARGIALPSRLPLRVGSLSLPSPRTCKLSPEISEREDPCRIAPISTKRPRTRGFST
jgi:hypothetical protein